VPSRKLLSPGPILVRSSKLSEPVWEVEWDARSWMRLARLAAAGNRGDELASNALAGALHDHALRGVRQAEEHFLRKATQSRAQRLRDRLQQGVRTGAEAISGLARQMLKIEVGPRGKQSLKTAGARRRRQTMRQKTTEMESHAAPEIICSCSRSAESKATSDRTGAKSAKTLSFRRTASRPIVSPSGIPIVYDALLVAAAAEFADRTQRRPALACGEISN
jgi:hypothetical protein